MLNMLRMNACGCHTCHNCHWHSHFLECASVALMDRSAVQLWLLRSPHHDGRPVALPPEVGLALRVAGVGRHAIMQQPQCVPQLM
jgi:hypothetical protein